MSSSSSSEALTYAAGHPRDTAMRPMSYLPKQPASSSSILPHLVQAPLVSHAPNQSLLRHGSSSSLGLSSSENLRQQQSSSFEDLDRQRFYQREKENVDIQPMRKPMPAIKERVKRQDVYSSRNEPIHEPSIMDDDAYDVPSPSLPLKNPRRKQVAEPGTPSTPPKKAQLLLDAYGIPIGAADAAVKKKKLPGAADRIRVCVRKRPLSSKEIRKNEQDVAIALNRRNLAIQEPKYGPFLS